MFILYIMFKQLKLVPLTLKKWPYGIFQLLNTHYAMLLLMYSLSWLNIFLFKVSRLKLYGSMIWSVLTNVVLTQVKTSAQLTCIRLGVRHFAPTRLLILSKKLSVKRLNCAYFRCYFVFVLVMLTAVHKKGKKNLQRRFDTFTAIFSSVRA